MNKLKNIFLGLFCSSFLISVIWAEDSKQPIKVEAKIESVVVYELGAKVTKSLDLKKLNLQPGSNQQLVFEDLPFSLSGVKVELSGDSTVIVSKLVKEVCYPLKELSDLEAQIIVVQNEIKQLNQELEITESKVMFIKNIEFAMTSKEDLQHNLNILSEKLKIELDIKDKLTAEIKTVNDKLASLNKEVDVLKLKKQRFNVFIDLDVVEFKNDAYLKLIYIVDEASFEVNYDARIIMDDSTLEILPKIKIKNNSGQDWKSVALSLHGGLVNDDLVVPVITALNVNSFLNDRILSSGQVKNSYIFDIGLDKTVLFGEEKEFVSPVRTLNAEYKYVAFPSFSNVVYFKAITNNDSQEAYMPGKISLFLGRNYIGERQLDFTPPFSLLEIYVDRSDTIMVNKVLVSKSVKEEGIFEITKKYVLDYRISFRNFADTHLTNVLEIVDVLPVAENEQNLQIETISIAPIEINKKKGLVKWSVELFPGVEGEIDYRLSVTVEN